MPDKKIQNDIEHAAQLVKQNKLVAFPTETVYGLGGNALSDEAVAAIYAAKARPQFNPLIVHIRSLEEGMRYAEWNDTSLKLAKHFWPGPLTLVLPRKADCPLSLLASAGLQTVALRMPAHPIAQALLHEAGIPLAAPSANRSGRVSPTNAQHVQEELASHIAYIVDGGQCKVGIESTIVDVTGEVPMLLRPGSISIYELSAYAPSIQAIAVNNSKILAPGMLQSHYAPVHSLRMNATYAEPDEALLAFGPRILEDARHTMNLSLSGNLQEAAANLFRMLRELDTMDISGIAVMPIPDQGKDNAIGAAINDRLRRAAAPKTQA